MSAQWNELLAAVFNFICEERPVAVPYRETRPARVINIFNNLDDPSVIQTFEVRLNDRGFSVPTTAV
jgi:hypothetical protein